MGDTGSEGIQPPVVMPLGKDVKPVIPWPKEQQETFNEICTTVMGGNHWEVR